MKKKVKTLLFLLVLGVGSLSGAMYVQANAGGQVNNDAGITFYEESTATSESSSTVTSSSTSPSSSTSTSSTSGTLPDTEGGGKLPSTGETIRNYSFIGGGVLLVVLLFLLYRRKKDKEGNA